MAELHGQALVPAFIMPDQILQSLKKCLPDALGHLEGQSEQEEPKKEQKNEKTQTVNLEFKAKELQRDSVILIHLVRF